MNALLLPGRTVFICDTYVTPDPDAEHIAEMTVLAAEEIRRFGLVPKVALLSGSLWAAAAVAFVMFVVVLSYRQNVHAYPEDVPVGSGPARGLRASRCRCGCRWMRCAAR